ncbi:hypothetical protein ASG89_27955 [Paenibacillus sp. Soil766]|uniref:DUF5667 domain-containing protein n=1 Tax=Paenibacillus sp. Soil766 TaxID=1736404 RepID=UPI00070BC859|nr:DUF5667 domain-containing protein [Paenibacillus sp. Soil766]KRE99397.1 hypothetical protein ASG89_27955 [Paenibacillus sp. Soil766]
MKVMFTKEPKKYKLLTKSVMLSMLVFSVGSSYVLASEIPTPTPSSTPVSVNVTQSKVDSTQTGTETLGLLPGDFFYFVKTIYENIQLALTVNDVKEARLLTAFAQERLAEANTLLAKGKTNEANLSLQKSLETQQSAIQKTEQASGLTTTKPSEPAATPTPSAEADVEVAITITADQGTEQSSESDQTDTEDVNVPTKEVKHPEQVLKVKTDLQHNILALASALEKVGNPKAQSALMKNIEKSFAHLDKKLSKIEKKTQQEQTNENVTAKVEQEPVASIVPTAVPSAVPPVVQSAAPSTVTTQVRNESVSIKEKEKEDHTKKNQDNQEKNRSNQEKENEKVKEKKNNNGNDGKKKENGKGHDKNKDNNQE